MSDETIPTSGSEAGGEAVAWHCVGAGENWSEDKIIRHRGSAEEYAKLPDQWSVKPLFYAALAKPAPEPAGDVREAELIRAASALLDNLWQDVWSHERTHEENWKEFDRKYPGVRWLRDARDAALSAPASAPGSGVARRDDPFRPAVDVDADDDYYPSREDQ